MPFGAECEGDGAGTRFRLWAPGARQVDLWLEDQKAALPMPLDAAGWAELTVASAGPGTRYRFRIDADLLVPDPASRYQPEDVHGPSEVIAPPAHAWSDAGWRGVEPERLVCYELHVGTFTREGTFAAAEKRLDHLAALGVTAVELMPLADFPGRWGWGYDGVLPFAPDASYGRPEDLKRLVDACHARGLAVLLDVVYNHFGPEGNYLHRYAPDFGSPRHRTPWGDGINFDGPRSAVVRQWVVHNALYWLEEFHLDGLRLDAVHAIIDDSRPHILEELAAAVDAAALGRPIHLVLENEANSARRLARGARPHFTAQWNDDLHHVLHVLLTGERDGYYADYFPALPLLGRCLTEGFAYQGDWSSYRGHERGEGSRELPPTAFVGFLQNHDQIGNRALGERITALAPDAAVRAATAVLLLAPATPLLFMGQEWGAREPFLFFSDLGPELAAAVSEGRRREFARFPQFADPVARARIPDPQAEATRDRSTLDWDALGLPRHAEWLAFHRSLLAIRGAEIAPLLAGEPVPRARWRPRGPTALEAEWVFPGDRVLTLVANLGPAPATIRPSLVPAAARRLYASNMPPDPAAPPPAWSVGWSLREGPA